MQNVPKLVLMFSFRVSHFLHFYSFNMRFSQGRLMVLLSFLMIITTAYSDEIHTLESNETIYQISQKYNIPIEILLNSNSIRDPNHLPIGKKIRIPEEPQVPIKNVRQSVQHVVVKGDTLYSIAQQYNTDVKTLEDLNGLSNASIISPGTVLTIESQPPFSEDMGSSAQAHTRQTNSADKPYAYASAATETYIVAKGDTLYAIAEKYKTSIQYLQNLNKLSNTDIIKPGHTLIVSTAEGVEKDTRRIAPKSSTTAATLRQDSLHSYDKIVIPSPHDSAMSTAQTSKVQASSKVVNNNPKPAFSTTATLEKPQKPVAKSTIEQPALANNATTLLLDRAKPFGVVSKQFPVKGTSYVLTTHSGVFIESDVNSLVKAVESGRVLYIVPSHGTFRNILVIQSKAGEIFVYGCQQDIAVKQGQSVAKGQVLGKVGIMPLAQKPVLYFAVFKKDKFINPKKFLS